MILKISKTTHKLCLISIIIFCFSQPLIVSASTEPIIRVLILKDKKIRIRSDRSIPLIIKGQRFSNKTIKGLTLKKQKDRTNLFFDKNKQKIYNLKNEEKLSLRTSDKRGIWVGNKRYAGKLEIFIRDMINCDTSC